MRGLIANLVAHTTYNVADAFWLAADVMSFGLEAGAEVRELVNGAGHKALDVGCQLMERIEHPQVAIPEGWDEMSITLRHADID